MLGGVQGGGGVWDQGGPGLGGEGGGGGFAPPGQH